MSKFGMFSDKDSKYLFAEAFHEMLSTVDKGIDPNDIDALYLGNFTNDFFVQSRALGSDNLGFARACAEAGNADGGCLRFERTCTSGRGSSP
jgi:hypothetical protein